MITPIGRFLQRILPRGAWVFALCLIYSFLLLTTASLLGYRPSEQITYLDIGQVD